MTKAQRDAIATPAIGLMIYETDNNPTFYYYTGSIWKAISGTGRDLSNLITPTRVNVDLLPGTTAVRNLGSSTKKWQNLYLSGSLISRSINSEGDATINGITVGKGAAGFYPNSANTAVGIGALSSNLYSNYNTAVGANALSYNTEGMYNTAIGLDALILNTLGGSNTAIGSHALFLNSEGFENTACGYHALFNNTDGYNNTANGNYALSANTSGTYNTALGNNANCGEDLFNATAIGTFANADASNKVQIGNSEVTSIGGQVSWSTFSDGRYKRILKKMFRGSPLLISCNLLLIPLM